ncbi:DUF1345 domain-containing protein [Yersinia aldovae]|uniref:Transmembrane protein n=1 Tax=Yersinia aldovae TaxID=29483 RepID=A0A0T9UQT0_YERAL|nr:DUF1345 domain-containing protein [Yersinia aldovae]AJJ63837.1 hypothetical protein AT01_2479 [Yersinia aldovae 670-83]EEP94758.1 hypothetical protein yaldo0001_33750 [Yersinia aldovae ATCC 35236]CNJ41717.1 putative transmembrane protein [Yersinia aldovae]CNK63173.1 putative transmembrane protein [Yersinia aldovae]CNL62389.1 putative transmembrane protein [Yersinia aldovae]
MLLFHPVRHYLHTRPRLLLSVSAGVITYFLLPSHFTVLLRLMVSWNVSAWLYLLFLWLQLLRTDPTRIRKIARVQDESASMVLSIVSMSCLASILVILFELSTANQLSDSAKAFHLVLTGMTLLVSWLLLPTAFTMHYAHLFYLPRDKSETVLPLLFPKEITTPSYWDFLYFSFTIGVASQTADVSTGTSDIRRVVLLQSVLSFIFNMTILGLSINVGAGLLN